MDVERLVRADPRIDALVEDADALGVGMRVQAAADGARAQPAAPQDARRVPRARGQHDQRRADLEAARARRPSSSSSRPRDADRLRAAATARDRPARRSAAPRPRRARAAPRVTSIDCLAPVGQPSAQLLSPTQRRMLRGARASGQPSASAPRTKRCVLRPKVSSWFGSTCRMRSASSKYGSMARGPRPASPSSRSQRVEHRLGRPPRHAAVDHRRAADAPALGEDDRRVAEDHARAGVAVEPADHRRRIGGEGLGAVQRAFLQHEHVEAGRRAAVPPPSRRRRRVPTTTASA